MREYQAVGAKPRVLCAPLAEYSRKNGEYYRQLRLFDETVHTKSDDVRVVELFAGVGGFRVGLEQASPRFKTVWNNQWEPSTKRQDASIIYCGRFGSDGHSNEDIATVDAAEIPVADLLVAGFPCQDYSVAATLVNSKGLEGKKGVLWWQIHRILRDTAHRIPYLFLENVDRLLKSPASQRGRDFAIILASLSDLGYSVEWRVINAADYGMPQRRRRIYIVAYHHDTPLAKKFSESLKIPFNWILDKGVIARAFPSEERGGYKPNRNEFVIDGDLAEITENFNVGKKKSPFGDAGVMSRRRVWTTDVESRYDGMKLTLGDLLVAENEVPAEFFIDGNDLERWKYMKGSKSEMRMTPEGYEYRYSEGGMAFPDPLDRPSRTIITGEGGKSASRFKHVVMTESGRYRRLVPLELERLNMFPDNHTAGASDMRRAFLMGNALVTGIVEKIGLSLADEII